MRDFPLPSLVQTISNLSESSEDLYSCLLVNRTWCECAVAYLWRKPFHWPGNKSGRMAKQILQLLHMDGSVDSDAEDSKKPMIDYLSFVKTMSVGACIKALEH